MTMFCLGCGKPYPEDCFQTVKTTYEIEGRYIMTYAKRLCPNCAKRDTAEFIRQYMGEPMPRPMV